MAKRIKPGDWLLFNGGHDEQRPLWLGRAMPKEEWDGKCTWENNDRGNVKWGDTIIGRNSIGINVQWYEKAEAGVDDRKYQISRNPNSLLPSVQHFNALLHSGFNMYQYGGPAAGRFSIPRLAAFRTHQEREDRFYRYEYSRVWVIDEKDWEQGMYHKY